MLKLIMMLFLRKRIKRLHDAYQDGTYEQWLNPDETEGLRDIDAIYRFHKKVGIWEFMTGTALLEELVEKVESDREIEKE